VPLTFRAAEKTPDSNLLYPALRIRDLLYKSIVCS
jgi:hypothetical protein